MWSLFGVGALWLRQVALQRRRDEWQQRQSRDGSERGLRRHVSFQSEVKAYAVLKALDKSPYSKELHVALELALAAGNNMTAYCDAKGTEAETHYALHLTHKGQPEDFCTQVDVENERVILEGLLKHFPSH